MFEFGDRRLYLKAGELDLLAEEVCCVAAQPPEEISDAGSGFTTPIGSAAALGSAGAKGFASRSGFVSGAGSVRAPGFIPLSGSIFGSIPGSG
jgi:hypothetical protein